jgi:hypothetical protein
LIVSKGIVGFIVVIVALALVAYLETGFHLAPIIKTATTTLKTTTTISGSLGPSTTINYSSQLYPCEDFNLSLSALNSVVVGSCLNDGGTLGLWVASGTAGRESVLIKGAADNKTYVNQSSAYGCTTFYQNVTLPAQAYRVTLKSGLGGGSCSGETSIELNTTTTPPPKAVYSDFYNGDFGSGQYNGWMLVGQGFGSSPLNITYADSNTINCYLNQTWSNYNGTFFATTYHCGLTVTSGNLTSSPFYVNASKPFLNFRIISPERSGLYVEVLQNDTPMIIAHYNTFNLSNGYNSISTFSDASIPLSTLVNKVVRIRVVASVVSEQTTFIAVGDFALAETPIQQRGILTNMTFVG